jgi:hypothetical protein
LAGIDAFKNLNLHYPKKRCLPEMTRRDADHTKSLGQVV